MILLFSLLLVGYGVLYNEAEPIALGGIIYFFSYPIKEFRNSGINSINPVSLFAFIKGMASLGNLVGLLSKGDLAVKHIYFKYASEDHLVLAMSIHFFGSLFCIAGFEKALSSIQPPMLNYTLSKKQMELNIPILITVITILVFFNQIPSLGAISNMIKFIPIASVFFFARYGSQNHEPRHIRFAFILMLVTTLQALLYGFLRMQIVLPGIAFILGLLIGERSFKILKKPITYPIYAGAFLFFTYFSLLGETRTEIGSGLERVENFQTIAEEKSIDEDDESTFLSRFSNINQLSQIGRIVEEDGFYYGETLGYLIYSFIPRFIWPDKPLIQQGAWFAYKIGMGRLVDGKYTNSIDMTPAGELYLNFGWAGLLIGTFILGYLFGSAWLTTNFWSSEKNIMGSLFGFYLLFLGLFSFGADLQVIITLIAMYLIFLLINLIIGKGKQYQ